MWLQFTYDTSSFTWNTPAPSQGLCVSLVLRRLLFDFHLFSNGFLWIQSLCFSVYSGDPESVCLSAVSLVSAMPVHGTVDPWAPKKSPKFRNNFPQAFHK